SLHTNGPPTTDIYTLSLHDALPISPSMSAQVKALHEASVMVRTPPSLAATMPRPRCPWSSDNSSRFCMVDLMEVSCTSVASAKRSEEHTSELQSREKLVCRLLLEKK